MFDASRLTVVGPPVLLVSLLLASCSSEGARHAVEAGPVTSGSELPAPAPAPHAGAQRVESSGISFEVPEGWVALDASEIFEGGAGYNGAFTELADRLGLERDQLMEVMRTIDLFLFSDEGAHDGFLGNINVLASTASLNESQLRLEMLRLGATAVDVTHTTTGLGETMTTSYEVELGGQVVRGGGVYVTGPEGAVAVTVATSDAETTRRLVAQIRDSVHALEPDTDTG